MTPDEPSFDSASPAPELFGPAWADRLERELAVNEPYRAAAASWKGSLAFELQPDGTPGFPVGRGLFLDLAHGSCRAARPALPGDLENATFCLSGPAAVWLRLLTGSPRTRGCPHGRNNQYNKDTIEEKE